MLSALELALCPGWFLPDLRKAAVNPVADAPSLAIPSNAILPFVRTKIPAVSMPFAADGSSVYVPNRRVYCRVPLCK